MARTITTRLAVEGEAQYKQAISACNSQLATLKSSLALAESAFQGNANSMDALTAKGTALQSMYDKQKEKVATLESALKNCQSAQEAYAARVADAKEHIAQCEKALAALGDAAGDTSAEQKALTAELDRWNAELSEAEAGQAAAERGVQSWQKQLNYAKVELNDLDGELAKNNQYLAEAEQSADGCAQSIDEYGNEVRDAGDASQEFGSASVEAINSLAQALVAAGLAEGVKKVAETLLDCVDTFAAFEAQMSTVQAISGATGNELVQLSEKAKQMGATTAFTATEAAKALEYMAMAGWSTEEMLGGLEGVMNLAAASGEDLASVSDIVTDGLTAFGLAASDSSHFADVLAAASSKSNTNVSMMGESFKYVAPVAGALRYSIEDVSVAIGLMANSGVKGSSAGTTLRTALSNLVSPTKSAAAVMEQYGISLTDTDGSMLSLAAVMEQLREKLRGLDETTQSAAITAMFGKEAMSGMTAIISASDEDFQKLTESINNCNGAAQEMAQIRLDNYAGQVTLLESAIDGLKMTIGGQLAPVLELIAKGATTAVGGLNILLERCPVISAALVGLTASIGVTVVAFSGFSILQAITPALIAFNTALAANPAGMAAIAIVGVVTALGTLAASCANASDGVGGLNKQMRAIESTYQTTTASTIATAEAANGLIDKLAALEQQQTMTQGEAALYAQTVDQLKAMLPDLNIELDEQTGLLVGGADALRAQTEAWKENALAQAMQEKYSAVLEGQAEALIVVAEKQLDYNDALATCTDLEKQMEATAQELQRVNQDTALTYEEKSARVNELNQRMNTLSDQYVTAKDRLGAYNGELENAKEAAGAFDAELEKLNSTQAALNGAFSSTGDAAKDFQGYMESIVASMKTLEEAYEEAAAAALESIETQFKLWEDLGEAEEKSAEDLLTALNSQINYWKDYSKNIDSLMARNIDGLDVLVAAYSDGSAESAAAIAAMAKATDKELNSMVNGFGLLQDAQGAAAGSMGDLEVGYTKGMRDISSATARAMSQMDLSEEAKMAGMNTMQGYVDGINSKSSSISTALRNAANSAMSSFKSALRINSPSKAFREFGNFTIEGYEQGVDDRTIELQRQMEDVARAAAKSFEESAQIDAQQIALQEQRARAQAMQASQYFAAADRQASGGGDIILNFNLDGVVVREEADIRKIARELYALQANEMRSRGLRL